jgi:RNA polymerase sigma-70 factor (ECF subfamily)
MQDGGVGANIETDRHAAIEAIYREHGDRLWRALRLATASEDVASEVLAEAFAQLIARGVAIRDPGAWVWRSAFKIAAGEMQRRGRHDPLPQELPVESPELLVDLERALRTLSPHQRTAVILAEYAGWSHMEIARTLHSTPAAVGVHVHRARRRLRALLEVRDV